MAIDAPGKTIAASLDGDHFIPGWHPEIEIDASRDGDRWDGIPEMVMRHPGMAIDASLDGDPCIRRWRSIHHGMASQHPWMAIDASRDGDH